MDLASSCKDKLAYFRVKELKEVLTELGLSKQGRKLDLVDRILAILSDDRVSGTSGKKNAVGKEKVAKLVDDTYRKMQVYGAADLAPKSPGVSNSTNIKLQEKTEDSYKIDKIRSIRGSSLPTDSMIMMHRGNSSRGGGRGDKGKKKATDELIAADRVRSTGFDRQKRVAGADLPPRSSLLRIRRSALDPTFAPPRQTVPEDLESDESAHVTPVRPDGRPTTGGKWQMMSRGPSAQYTDEEMVDDTDDVSEEETVRPTTRTIRHSRGSSNYVGETSRRKGDEAWRLKTGIDGGPSNPELLSGFLGHVAYQIWTGQDRGPLQGENKYHVLRSWVPNSLREDARDLVYGTGLGSLYESMYRYIDMPLISAFIERWHPETNSFHMPFGEMTITLHDVHYLLRIPIDGAPVVLTSDALRDIMPTTADFLGMPPEVLGAEWRSGASVKFTTIHACMSVAGLAADEVAAGYLLWMLGASIFSDKNKNTVTAQYLPLLLNVDEISRYSWGSAALAYLYRQLGIASRADCRTVSGCLSLLQAWIYAYFPALEGRRNEEWSTNQPYASKWQATYATNSHDALIRYRRLLDRCRENEIEWTPFRPTPGLERPISLYSGIIHCRHIKEPYMPERVLRQFGYAQTIPWIPAEPDNVTWSANPKAYLREHHEHPSTFLRALSSPIQPGMISFRVTGRYTMVDEYLSWYLPRTHPRVDKASDDSAQSPNDIENWEKAYSMLEDMHPLIRPTQYDPNDMENTMDTLCYMFEHHMPRVMKRREM